MNTYNTGNPVEPNGSTDPRDLYDNAQNFDLAINGSGATFVDRKGVTRKTMTGYEDNYINVVNNLAPLGKVYSLTEANEAIASGEIANGTFFFVWSDDPNSIADKYQNIGGIATATGKSYPSSEVVESILKLIFEVDSSVDFLQLIDDNGEIVAVFDKDESGNIGFSSKHLRFGDDGIYNKTISLNDNVLSNAQFVIDSGVDGYIFIIKDIDGNFVFGIRDDGKTELNLADSKSDPFSKKSAENIAELAAANVISARMIEVPRKKLSIYLIYGQSYSVGADSYYPLSTTNMFGNMMLGKSPRGSNYNSLITNYTFGPVGGANTLYPLVEVQQSDVQPGATAAWGETCVSGLVNTLKYLHNNHMRTDNDDSHIFAGAACGVSGAPIAQLSKGATPEYYQRFLTALTGFKEAADAQGYDASVCGILFMQGESDNGQTHDYYLSKLNTLYSDMIADVKAVFPGNQTPVFCVGGMGGYFQTDSETITKAQMDFCDNNPLAMYTGPYAYYPNPQYHLFSNSYRWFGCHVAKLLHKAYSGQWHPTFRMRNATHNRNVITIGFRTPYPPLRLRTAYVGYTPTDFVDAGFTVKDGLGTLTGSNLSVLIVADTVIQITCSRNLSGAVTVSLGDKTYHTGVHNVADSDPSQAFYTWDFYPGTNQNANENIPALVGKPYELFNRSGAEIINSTLEV